MTRYFFVILLMALIGVAIVVKAGITMFAERQYWQDVEQEDAGNVNALFHRNGATAVGTPHAEQAAPDKAEPARKHGRTDEAGQEQRQRVFELQRNT